MKPIGNPDRSGSRHPVPNSTVEPGPAANAIAGPVSGLPRSVAAAIQAPRPGDPERRWGSSRSPARSSTVYPVSGLRIPVSTWRRNSAASAKHRNPAALAGESISAGSFGRMATGSARPGWRPSARVTESPASSRGRPFPALSPTPSDCGARPPAPLACASRAAGLSSRAGGSPAREAGRIRRSPGRVRSGRERTPRIRPHCRRFP